MRTIFVLALRDLFHQKVHLICSVATLAGVIVPLLVLFGIKNGVYNALIGRLLSDPATLQIDTSGNESFSREQAELVRTWPEAGFVTPKTRSLFDYVNVRVEGGREKREALLIPSGTGDPNLPPGLNLVPSHVVVSAGLASQLGIDNQTRLQVFTQAEDRPRQLLLTLDVVSVLSDGAASGRTLYAHIDTLDLIEAFYDGYALPDYGIEEGRPLADRTESFEGLRVFARDLVSLAPLQTRLEQAFGVQTVARSTEVGAILALGRNLNLALLFTASVAAIGLAAALVFGFWGEVARKRQVMASLALLGIGGGKLWLFPVIQALTSGIIGIVVSFALFVVARAFAERLFDSSLTAETGLVSLSVAQAMAIIVLILAFVVATSLIAAHRASQTDPADVLREGAV